MADRLNLILYSPNIDLLDELQRILKRDVAEFNLRQAKDIRGLEALLRETCQWDLGLFDGRLENVIIRDFIQGLLSEDDQRLPVIYLSRTADWHQAQALMNLGVDRVITLDDLPLLPEIIMLAACEGRRWRALTHELQELRGLKARFQQAVDAACEEESRYATLAENARDSIFELSGEGDLIYLNQQALDTFGVPASQIIGKNITELFPPQAAQRMLANVKRVYRSDEPYFSIDQISFPKEAKYLGTWLVQFKDNKGKCHSVLGFSRDYTEIKQGEENLKLAVEKQKEINRLHAHFIMRASHEFRTPLSTILSSTELLENYGWRWPKEKVLTHLQRIKESVKYLNNLLDDLSTIEKADSASWHSHPAPIELTTFLSQLADEMQLVDHNLHRIIFQPAGACYPACMDERLLRQVTTNLLLNAIKFSAPGTEITLDLQCDEDYALIRVSDHGIGIPLEDQPHLFERFYRAKNVVSTAGSGLGLPIVKEAVTLMDGEISFTSQEGVGSVFTVRMPLNQPPR